MRKYRAWDVKGKQWREGFLDYDPMNGDVEIHVVEDMPLTMSDPCGDVFSKRYRIDPDTIGQNVGKIGDVGVYVGDVIRIVHAEAEFQTHCGANVPRPCGCYTEQIDTNIEYSYFIMPEPNLDNIESIFSRLFYRQHFDENELFSLCGLPNNRNEDETVIEFFNIDLGTKLTSIDEVLKLINGIEVIGNIHDNPELKVVE